MDEKDIAYVDQGMTDAEREAALIDRKGSVIGEAAVIYGDVETAEKYGYVERALKSRHVQFIALGGTIGTGLFVGIAGALASSGPLGILIGYSLTGIFVYGMMLGLGESTTWIPMPGAIPQMAARYADPALGFAVGYNQWYNNGITQCAEISAATLVIAYWDTDQSIDPAVWISILMVLIFALNIFAVGIYGESEFWFASIKIITIVGLIILAFIIDLGGSPRHHRLGFQYWNDPGALPASGGAPATGDAGRFLAVFNTLINAAFSYGGVETVAVAAGEAENPRKNIPKAVRRVFWRILFFYCIGSLAIGVMVPYTNKALASNQHNANSSPWVIGIKIAQIDTLPSIINAVILTSATSAGNSFLYSGSRYLFGLAQNGHAPRILLTCSKKGLPWICVCVTALFMPLTYLIEGNSSSTVFNWFLNLTTIATLFTWVSICITNIRFRAAIKAQGVDPKSMPMHNFAQPYLSWAALVFFSIIILFNGWTVFTSGSFTVSDFAIDYVGVPIFFILYLFWKIFKRPPFIRAHDADIWTGKAAVDAEVWPELKPRNFLEKVWMFIV